VPPGTQRLCHVLESSSSRYGCRPPAWLAERSGEVMTGMRPIGAGG
jgi:hypothetical protein